MEPLRSGLTVSALCAEAECSAEAKQLLAEAPDSRVFVTQLMETALVPDAVTFLAHALPRREAVWWAWLCARDSIGAAPKPVVAEALESTKTWIAEPTDEHRRAALSAGETAGFGTPVGLAALAAFLCGDTLGPAGGPPAPPGPFDAAKAITGCVHMSAVADPKADIPARYAEFVKRGIELADRIKLWTPDDGTDQRKGTRP